MMRTPFLLLVLALTACGGSRDKPPTAAAAQTEGAPRFIEIDLSEEEEELNELVGSELWSAVAPCGDLIALEPSAIMGRLKDSEIRCLDQTLRQSDKQTVKKKISLVLMKDAWAKSDLHRWEGVVRRHLTEIDQSDPAMTFVFARYLSQKGPDYADEAIRWADRALENRTVWVGEEHVERVYALRQMKAVAAHKEWEWMAARYAKEPTEELESLQSASRNQTKTMAREWLDFARTAQRDDSAAYQLCISAAGTDGFCEAETAAN